MRFLLDENLSFRLGKMLQAVSPGSLHVRQVGLLGHSDGEVWAYAKRHDLVVLTRDKDFLNRSYLEGAPPKVVLLRIPNGPPREAYELLVAHQDAVARLLLDDEASCLVIEPLE